MSVDSQQLVRLSNGACRAYLRPQYSQLKSCVINIKGFFEENGTAIHADRNIIKVFDQSLFSDLDEALVVKSFKVPHPPGRFIYRFFRDSKAKRSLVNSLYLEQAGFSVPSPVAYTEYFENVLLKESFFVSKKLDYDCTLHEVYRKQLFNWHVILPLVVEQAYRMHSANLMHRDFSHGNVLVKQVDDGYLFSFVDLNRLYIGPVTFKQGLKSLVRLANDDETLALLARYYAQHAGRDESEAFKVLSEFLSKHRSRKKLKQKFKDLLGIKKSG